MCKASTPNYEKPPAYARAKQPDNAALFEEARARAASRGTGQSRSTLLTGLRGTTKPPVLGRPNEQRMSTVLG